MIDLLQYKDQLKIITKDYQTLVFDPIRKKEIVLTSEEMVRQLFLIYLIGEKSIPIKHIAVERQIEINNRLFRFDILVFNRQGHPSLIIECKSPKVKLTELTSIQVSKYNLALEAKYLCLTNGINTYFHEIDLENKTIDKINSFPSF